MTDYTKIVGKSYIFEDNASIRVLHVRRRGEGMIVMFETNQGNGLPKRTIMPYHEFMDIYGHLFEDK